MMGNVLVLQNCIIEVWDMYASLRTDANAIRSLIYFCNVFMSLFVYFLYDSIVIFCLNFELFWRFKLAWVH